MQLMQRLQADPAAFRQNLLIDVDGEPKRLGDVLDPWQRQDFTALDAGWKAVAGQPVPGAINRAYLERPRGHSKTNDLAVMSTWGLFASRRKLRGFAAAADKDQGKLLRDAIDQIIRLNPWLSKALKVKQWSITNIHTGSTLEIISSDAATSYGLTPDFIIVDELSHWAKRDLWDSLLSSAAKRKNCMLMIISNAGFQESWQWETRETIRQDESWYFSRLEGPTASWITENRLAEQRKLLPAIAFNRLWLNEWSAGSGDALQDDDIKRAVRLKGPLAAAEEGWIYFAGVDLGLTKDASAVVVIGKHIGQVRSQIKPSRRMNRIQQAMVDSDMWDEEDFAQAKHELIERYEEPTGKIKLAAVRLWRPQKGKRVLIEHIEKTLLRLDEQFHFACVGFDPWQAVLLRERISQAGIQTEEVPFTPNNLTSMCSAVLENFNENRIELFEHPQLLSDLRKLRVVEKSYGVRLDSPRGLNGHGDAATALSIALHLSSRISIANHMVPHAIIAE